MGGWVKSNKIEFIRPESSRSSDKFNSIAEKKKKKKTNLDLYGLKVPAFRISSIPWLNKGKFERIQNFRLLQLRIRPSSFGVLRHWNFSDSDCTSKIAGRADDIKEVTEHFVPHSTGVEAISVTATTKKQQQQQQKSGDIGNMKA